MPAETCEVLLISENAALLPQAPCDNRFAPLCLTRTRRVREALALLAESQFDCVLVDLSRGGIQKPAAIWSLRAAAPGVPILVLASSENEEAACEAVRQGATDFLLVEDASQPLLLRCLLHLVERKRLEDQLHQSQKMEALGRLVGGVTHDFNNLLTAILGFCEVLLQGSNLEDQVRSGLVEIKKAGARAAGLTQQLLGFCRKQAVPSRVVDLNDVMADRRSLLHRPRACRGGREAVLVVEDEPAVSGLVQLVLQQAGYKVLSAARGSEALRLSREYQGTIHLLITDLVMPQMSGRELAARLQALRPGLEVMFMSGYPEGAIHARDHQTGDLPGGMAGEIPFLEKPFSPTDLARCVRKTLDHERLVCSATGRESD